MSEIILANMSEYPTVFRHVLRFGERRAPRGLETLDTGFTTVLLLDPHGGMPLGIGRMLNPAIGAVEAIQLIAGISDPELVLRLAPQMNRYTDQAEYDPLERTFWGAYGERIKMQAFAQMKKLTHDRNTRQAIITLWDPWLDNVEGKKDYPCTIALQFSIHGEMLDMNTIMRSNDAWLGLPYDVFQFTQLQLTMARALGLQPGNYRHTTLSLHLYESNVQDALDLITHYDNMGAKATRETHLAITQPLGVGTIGTSFNQSMVRARQLISNEEIIGETPSERWYREQLHPITPNVG